MSPIKILLAEDHTLVRKGIRSLLESVEDFEIIAEAQDGREAIEMAEELKPDVVIMDISMPLLNGLEATRRIIQKNQEIRVLMLTMHVNEEYLFEVINAGASGYMVKRGAPEELIMAIQAVNRGEHYFSPSVSTSLVNKVLKSSLPANESADKNLTPREREVLQLIAEGKTNQQICDLLFISVKTVESHRTHIINKLDIHTTAQLIRYALKKGLASLE